MVSGHKRYNNKGEIVEQFEPYFNSGFDYDPDNIPEGVAIKMYYDALGRMVKTLNPDNSEQLVVFGIPEELNAPSVYAATPWERYHYSPNDLAANTNPGVVPTTSYWTPKSETIDPLGNVIITTEHKAHYDADNDSYEDVVMQYNFDIKGQLIESIDPFDRVISTNKYSTAGQMLKTTHIDRGEQTLQVDALNLPYVTNDAKGARSLFAYDNLHRPIFVWARDDNGKPVTKRQIMRYGDSDGFPNPENYNLKGKLFVHNDEAGKLTYEDYDFKGNNLLFYRQVITDDALTAYQKYVVDWDTFNPSHLSSTQNAITQVRSVVGFCEAKTLQMSIPLFSGEYDALNRIRKATYPADRDGPGKEMVPKYNKGGALLSMKVDNTTYVKEVAYNARGQRILIAMGNKIMTRYAYDPKTFRVLRQRSALFNHSGHTYTPNAGIRQDLQYTYDLEGTITSINDAAPANVYARGPGNLLRVFAHDPLRRLISGTGREITNVYNQPTWYLNTRTQDFNDTNLYERRYTYNKIGNIQKLKHIADQEPNQDFNRDYTYDSSDNKLKSFTVNSTTYGNNYDPNGSLTKEGESRYYEWGANDKLAVFKNQAGSSTPSVYTNYFYNAQGERIKKHTRKGNKIVVTFYMDGGMFETTYTKTVGGSIDNNRYFNTIKISDDGALIATIRVGKNVDDSTPDKKYIVGDHLNNSTAVLKATTGSLINREEYYPFGETSFGSFKFKRYRYNGKEKDEESGLYEYGQRYYAPWLCRFVSVDPIAEDYPHLSSYNYASNRPVTSIDLEGLQTPDEPSTNQQKNNKTSNPKEARSIKKYEKKFDKLLSEERVNNVNTTEAQVHDRMAELYNHKKWMWVKDKSGKDQSKGYDMGSGGKGNKYFHVGELVRDEEIIQVTGPQNNLRVLDPTTFGLTQDGQQQILGMVYQLPQGIQGKASFQIQQSQNQWSVSVYQGQNPQESILGNTTRLNETISQQGNQNSRIDVDVNANNGNILYLVIGNRNSGGDASLSSRGVSATITSVINNKIKIPYSPKSNDSSKLNKGTIESLSTIYRNTHGIPQP